MGDDPPAVEGPRRLLPTVGLADGGYGPRTSTGRYMNISTHRGGAGEGGIILDRGVYCPPSEQGRTIH